MAYDGEPDDWRGDPEDDPESWTRVFFIPSPWGLGPLPRLHVWATKQWRPAGRDQWLAHEIVWGIQQRGRYL